MKSYPRWQKRSIEESLRYARVATLLGARQCGKTTLAKTLASGQVEYRSLDDNDTLEAARNDPKEFVRHDKSTLIIDEFQRVPDLLLAVKRAVDEDGRPGQFLLTGSSNIFASPVVMDSLAGRMRRIQLRPLARGEMNKVSPGFLDAAFSRSFTAGKIPAAEERGQLLELAFRGGFAEAARLDHRHRRRWHDDYVESLLHRDLRDVSGIRRHGVLRDLVFTMAAWSGRYMNLSAIRSGLSIHRDTLESYIEALKLLYLVEPLRPWTKTDYAQVGKQRKIFMTDSGLMASVLGWRLREMQLGSDQTGKIFETFVFNELAAQADVESDMRYEIFHYRDQKKREIDFLIEREDGALLGIEVKASSTVKGEDFKHLRWFQKNLAGKNEFSGVVLYAGNQVLPFGAGTWAVPIGGLWARWRR